MTTGSYTREQVYAAIDSEREYQKKWETNEFQGQHEISAFILFMEEYLSDARTLVSKHAEENVRDQTLGKIRAVTALGVAVMEQHGAPCRS